MRQWLVLKLMRFHWALQNNYLGGFYFMDDQNLLTPWQEIDAIANKVCRRFNRPKRKRHIFRRKKRSHIFGDLTTRRILRELERLERSFYG